ncbi:hypothetical protein LINGRAHAP2_LOCUS5174 [Linum grandiflorum]
MQLIESCQYLQVSWLWPIQMTMAHCLLPSKGCSAKKASTCRALNSLHSC